MSAFDSPRRCPGPSYEPRSARASVVEPRRRLGDPLPPRAGPDHLKRLAAAAALCTADTFSSRSCQECGVSSGEVGQVLKQMTSSLGFLAPHWVEATKPGRFEHRRPRGASHLAS
jgi:hypothetical protein